MPRRPLAAFITLLAAGAALAGCGSQANDIKQPGAEPSEGIEASLRPGAKLFVERCSGCHNLALVGAEGGSLEVHGRERPDGPNFDVRKEDKDAILYAIRNGGYSGAIMPQDIVVGEEAEQVADFLAKYAGGGSTNTAEDAGAQGTSTSKAGAGTG